MKTSNSNPKAKNLKRSEAIFWMMAERPMSSFKSFNTKDITVHFSFGDYKIPRVWIAEMEVLKLITKAAYN